MSAATAVMYFLIGFHVVSVLDANADQSWAIFAGAAYAFGTLLLLAFDKRAFWILGALLQVFVILTYFSVASQRTPAYEVWGILIRIAQLMLLIALVYLVFRLPMAQDTGSVGRQS
jgi:flagellar biosynthesis protein FliR